MEKNVKAHTPAALHPAFTLVSCSAYPSTLKMEMTCSSKMSVDFQLTTWRYIPEDRTFRNYRYKNLKSYTIIPFPALLCLNTTTSSAATMANTAQNGRRLV
jgi:hypothetical protein